jgi:hypothetical protein
MGTTKFQTGVSDQRAGSDGSQANHETEETMRSWLIAALLALAIGMVAPVEVSAAPAAGQTTIDRATAGASPLQDVRYVVRCHHVRVWRDTSRGRRPVLVRRCHRVWVR